MNYLNRIEDKNTTQLGKLISVGLILLPILDQYQLFSLRFMDLFGIVIIFCSIILKKKFLISYKFVPYIIYVFIQTFISSMELSAVTPVLLFKNLISFFLLVYGMLILAPKELEVERAYRIYTKVVVIASLVAIFQFLAFQLLSVKTTLIIPGLTLHYGDSMSSSTFISMFLSYKNYRPSSFFLEPAYHSEYILPWIYMTLFNVKYVGSDISKRYFIIAVIASIGICLTTSILGIVGVAIAWIIYFEKNIFSRKGWKYALILPVFIVLGIYIIQLDTIQTQIVSKMFSLQNLDMSTSLSLRLMRGYYCFLELGGVQKLFGCGYGILYQVFSQYGIHTMLDTGNIVITYMNGFFLMVCSVGIVGSLLYLGPLISSVIKNKKIVPLFICWIILQTTAQVFDTAIYYLLMVFILSLSMSKRDIEVIPRKRRM